MKRKYLTLSVFLIILIWNNLCLAQYIEIGQDARRTLEIVKYTTKSKSGFDSYGNSKGNNVSYDVKYNDGQISEILQCFENQYLIDFRIKASYCDHYIVHDGIYDHKITQYENISTQKLKALFDNSYGETKMGNLYFTEDYEYYREIYQHNNGLASIALAKTKIEDMPLSIKSLVENKLENRERERLKEEERIGEEREREEDVTSKIYNLKEYDLTAYNSFIAKLRTNTLKQFSSKSYNQIVSNFSDIKNSKENYSSFNGTYDLSFILEDNSRPTETRGNVIIAGSRDIKTLVTIDKKSSSSTDNELNFKNVKLPTIEVEGYDVLTKVILSDFDINYIRGLATVKVKSGKVSFKDELPKEEIRNGIATKMANSPKGHYLVMYEYSDVYGEESIEVDAEKTKSKASKITKKVVGVLVLGALIYFGAI